MRQEPDGVAVKSSGCPRAYWRPNRKLTPFSGYAIAAVMAMGMWGSPPRVQAETESKSSLFIEEVRHEEALGSLRDKQAERIKKLQASYMNALDKLESGATERGDLETVLAVRKEKGLIGIKPLTEEQMGALAPEISVLRRKFDRTLMQIAESGRSNETGLLEKYARQLLNLQGRFTRKSEIEDAKKVREVRKVVLARLEAVRTAPALATLALPDPVVTKIDEQLKPPPEDKPDPVGETPDVSNPTRAKLKRVAESVRAKGNVEGPAIGVIPFDGPRGDGRRGAKGILVKVGDPGEGDKGSTWIFGYTRGGHARGLQIFHPRGKGQAIIHVNRDGVGLTAHGAWRKIGYSSGSAEGIRREKAFEDVFPLEDNREYAITSCMDGAGFYRLTIDGQIVATSRVGETAPLSLVPPESGRFPREPDWSKPPGFRGEKLPLEWEANWSGLLLGPLDRGIHVCTDVCYGRGVTEVAL